MPAERTLLALATRTMESAAKAGQATDKGGRIFDRIGTELGMGGMTPIIPARRDTLDDFSQGSPPYKSPSVQVKEALGSRRHRRRGTGQWVMYRRLPVSIAFLSATTALTSICM